MRAYALVLFSLSVGCSSGGSSTTTFTTTTATATATATATGSGGASSSGTATGSGSGSGSAGSDTGTASASSTGPATGSGGSSGSGGGATCDPVVPGEWNSCVNMGGQVDNTLCNWMGQGGATGFIGCLSSSSNPDANVCFISGCEDTCDCFAPPVTGDATVVCAEILQGGGKGCALSCENGETCPDGMSCLDNLCFWVPA